MINSRVEVTQVRSQNHSAWMNFSEVTDGGIVATVHTYQKYCAIFKEGNYIYTLILDHPYMSDYLCWREENNIGQESEVIWESEPFLNPTTD